MVRPRIERRNGDEQRNGEQDEQRHCGCGRRDDGRREFTPAPAGQPVDHEQRQAADQDLRPEYKADQPAGRDGFGIEHGGDDEQHRDPCRRDQGSAADRLALVVRQDHLMRSLASGIWATVARRDSCSARI